MNPTRRLDWEGDVVAVHSSASDREHDEADEDDAVTVATASGSPASQPQPRGAYQYVSDDHTTAASSRRFHHATASPPSRRHLHSDRADGPVRRRIAVLPTQPLPVGPAAAASADLKTPRPSTATTAAAAASGGSATTPADETAPRPSSCDTSGGTVAPCHQQGKAPYVLLRLPHPKHGRPSLYLCPTRTPEETATLEATRSEPGAHRPVLNAHLCEVQSQGPPGGYAQTWFLNYSPSSSQPGSLPAIAGAVQEVLPCQETLVVTPVHVGFMAIHALVAATRRGTGATGEATPAEGRFMPAEDLFTAANHHSPPQHLAQDGADTAVSPFDCTDPFTADEPLQKAPRVERAGGPGDEWGWVDWPTAVHGTPALRPCWHAMTSHDCLAPLCECREVGGARYYRFSTEKTVAWLARRVRAVQASEPLRHILQLDEGEGTTSTAAAAVPTAVALGVVGEYVPEGLMTALSVACGVDSATAAPVTVAPGVPAGSSQAPVSKPTAAVGKAPAPSLKSASVRRLEKAGRPKDTPTLFAMFSKKPSAPG